MKTPVLFICKKTRVFFCNGDEENGRRACTSVHLTTADQSGMRNASRLCNGNAENCRGQKEYES